MAVDWLGGFKAYIWRSSKLVFVPSMSTVSCMDGLVYKFVERILWNDARKLYCTAPETYLIYGVHSRRKFLYPVFRSQTRRVLREIHEIALNLSVLRHVKVEAPSAAHWVATITLIDWSSRTTSSARGTSYCSTYFVGLFSMPLLHYTSLCLFPSQLRELSAFTNATTTGTSYKVQRCLFSSSS